MRDEHGDILSFDGAERWLSNFEPAKVILEGRDYPTVEHAYQSAKNGDASWKETCSDWSVTSTTIKRLSRGIVVRSDWNQVKLSVMKGLIDQKFSQEPYLTKLLETGSCLIEEGNWWGDTYWGVNKNREGQNNLGKLIMNKRASLKSTPLF